MLIAALHKIKRRVAHDENTFQRRRWKEEKQETALGELAFTTGENAHGSSQHPISSLADGCCITLEEG